MGEHESAAIRRVEHAVGEIRRSLRVVRKDDVGVAQRVVENLFEAYGADIAHAHRPMLGASAWRIEDPAFTLSPAWSAIPSLHQAYMQSAPVSYAAWDPLLPAAEDRNRVHGTAAHRALFARSDVHMIREFYWRHGLVRLANQRVVVCDGPLMLTWLGLLREEPFSEREEALFESVAVPLARRLRIERMLHTANSLDGVAAAMQLVDLPAYLVRRDGVFAHANVAGRALLEVRGPALAAAVAGAARTANDTTSFEVTPVVERGAPELALVVLRGADEARFARAVALRRTHGLTAREAEVLALLARGDANKDIAAKLRTSVRTVDVHVRSVLQKCGAGSRAELVAAFWGTAG